MRIGVAFSFVGSLSFDHRQFDFLMVLKETLTFLSLPNPVLQYSVAKQIITVMLHIQIDFPAKTDVSLAFLRREYFLRKIVVQPTRTNTFQLELGSSVFGRRLLMGVKAQAQWSTKFSRCGKLCLLAVSTCASCRLVNKAHQ